MVQMLIVLCSMAILADTPEMKAEKEVLAAMNLWKQAMIARDRAALEALYAPKLTYTHSNGRQENKAEAIEAVVNGKDRFESIDLEDTSVFVYGSTVLVKARVILRINSGTATSTLTLDVLHVWMKLSSKWQMVARHALRLNPS
jgi:ketosteroid isomerase-like protein